MRAGPAIAVAFLWAASAPAQNLPFVFRKPVIDPQVQLGRTNFALPVTDYQAADGSWTRTRGVVVRRQVAPGTSVDVGLFKSTAANRGLPVSGFEKSRKAAIRLSVRF